jgi:hypothetical protein
LEENVDGHRTFQKCPNGPEIEFWTEHKLKLNLEALGARQKPLWPGTLASFWLKWKQEKETQKKLCNFLNWGFRKVLSGSN